MPEWRDRRSAKVPRWRCPAAARAQSTTAPPEELGNSVASRPDVVVKLPASPRSPRAGDGADDSQAGVRAAVGRAAEHQRQFAYLGGSVPSAGAATIPPRPSTFRTAMSVPGSRPATLASTRLPLGKRDLDLLVAANGVVGCHDDAGPPNHSAGRVVRARMDRHDARVEILPRASPVHPKDLPLSFAC